MSFHALKWAFDRNIEQSSVKFVLVAMANFASEDGFSYVTIGTICGMTSLSDNTVRSALLSLVDGGLLEDTGRTCGNTGRVKIYQFPPAARYSKSDEPAMERSLKKAKKGSSNPSTIPQQSLNNPSTIPQQSLNGCGISIIDQPLTVNREPGTREPSKPSKKSKDPNTRPAQEVAGKLKELYEQARGRVFVCDCTAASADIRAIAKLMAKGISPTEMAQVAQLALRQTSVKSHWHCCKFGGAETFARNYDKIREELNGELQAAMAGGVLRDPTGQRDEELHAPRL